MLPDENLVDSFDEFFRDVEPRLREALSTSLGSDAGREAAAEALAYTWEHWARVREMRNPAGYLYVLGRDRGRRMIRRRGRVVLIPVNAGSTPWVEPALPDALGGYPNNSEWW